MFIKMKVSSLSIDPNTNAPIVILKDDYEDKVLPIWIGIMEASAIASELEDMTFTRPMTHDLITNILKKTGVKVIKVEINDIKDSVYYASIMLEIGEKKYEIDSRPSDAIAIALRNDAPIFVHTSVIERSGKIELKDTERSGDAADDKEVLEKLENLSPDAFGKYKM